MNPIKRLPEPPTSPSAQGTPGRRFGFNTGIYIALSILLLVTGTGWGQGNKWKWLTGGKLNNVRFIGQRGWIIGDDGNQGFILNTTDDGVHWTIQPHNTGKHYLMWLYLLDSLNVWVVGGDRGMGENGFIMRTRDGGYTWSLESCPTTYAAWSVTFLDTTKGWLACAVDTVFRTSDGGRTWQRTQVANSCFGMVFKDSLRGWASGGGYLNRTTDGGISWVDTLLDLPAIDMADTLVGWGCVGGTYVHHTRDGWRSWQDELLPVDNINYGITVVTASKACVVGGDNGFYATIHRTTNAGASWMADTGITMDNAFYGVQGLPSDVIWVVGEAGSMLKTTNFGNTWTIKRNTDIKQWGLLNTTFYDANLGWATGENGVITHTINGGTLWNRQVSGTFNWVYGVDFPDPQKGWVCTDGAEILTTTNTGNTWTSQSSNTTYPLFSVDFVDTLFGIAVGGYYGPFDSSTVRQFDSSTVTEVPLVKRLEMLKQVSRIEFGTGRHDEEKGIRNDTLPLKETSLDYCKRQGKLGGTNPTTAYRTITRTTNGGATWIAQNTNANPLYGVKFITRGHGWACGDGGTILHTTDLGATWQTQSTGVTNGLYWITFKDTLRGWTCGSGGRVLWTTDGGNTWNIGNSGVTQYLNSIAFTDTLQGFATSDNGLIIRSTDGGRNWAPDTSKVYANFPAVFALDSTHVWTVGSFGMVLGWGEAGNTGTEQGSKGAGEQGRKDIGLGQSYPNPTTGIASFEFELGKAEKVRVKVYNVAGQSVRTLVEGLEPAGRHVVTWDGRDEAGRRAGSGTYFYCLEAGSWVKTRKMVVVK